MKRVVLNKEGSIRFLALMEKVNEAKEKAKIRIEERTKEIRERLIKELGVR